MVGVRRLDTHLEGPLLAEPVVHGDARGFFQETYRKEVWAELGVHDDFVQDNHSRSGQGVLRGMHFQPGQAKLVRCARGRFPKLRGSRSVRRCLMLRREASTRPPSR